MALDILYFAWVREGVGTGQECVEPPAGIATVGDLVSWLAEREGFELLADRSMLRAAVDQQFVPFDAPIAGAREIALFPPVTGG
ncbi:MAG: molybdopterin converting factor subunit 1 [Sphingomonas sp.]|uniref:molybdopterin converting factor subunit 1 n=1 Tax=Sphingomonas sp. TaxID=28214 RepID=UPI003F821FBF